MVFLYVVLLVISVFFYILYEGVISLMLLGFLVLLPIVLIICDLIARASLTADISLEQHTCSTGQSIPVRIALTNRSIIPIPNADIRLAYTISSSGTRETVGINTPVFPKNTQQLETSFSSAHLGSVTVSIERVKLYDILRLTRVRLSKKNIRFADNEIMILPETLELNNPVHDYSDSGLDSDVYSQDKAGDDPSEIFGLREYAEGDKLSRIHWKLTAKTDTLMVKDYSLPLADSCLILADTYLPDNSSESADVYDTIVRLAVSMSDLLRTAEIRHRVACYNSHTGETEQLQVTDDGSMIAAAAMLLRSGRPERSDLTVISLTAEETGQARFGHAVLVCAECSDAAAAMLSGSGLAERYSILICSADKQSAAVPDTDIETFIVDKDDPEGSISELSL